MSSYRTIIVIPYYTNNLNEAEQISLQQALKVFSQEPVCYVAPESLRISEAYRFSQVQIVRFADSYFVDTNSYSRLLMSEEFYARFSDYEFMLICQLDAFCFENRLDEFCALGYDYYGARVPKIIWPWIEHRVGNGGFSLRRIEACRQMARQKDRILAESTELSEEAHSNIARVEDEFFSYCGNRPDIAFRLPPYEVADDFSVEYNVEGRYESLSKHLPCGCHRWFVSDIDVWWPLIKTYGYDLSEEFLTQQEDEVSWPIRIEWKQYLISAPNVPPTVFESIFQGRTPVIWGYGIRGKRLFQFLSGNGFPVSYIIDKNAVDVPKGVLALRGVDDEKIRGKKPLLLVTPIRGKTEIIKEIDNLGTNYPYMTYNRFLKDVGKAVGIQTSFT